MKKIIALAVLPLILFACRKEEPVVEPVNDKPEPVAEVPVFDIENPTVKAYLNFVEAFPYRDNDYSYTYIDDYYQLTTSYRKDWPSPATVTWERDPDAISQKMYVSEDPSIPDGTPALSVVSTASSYDIYNLIPGKRYYWKIVASYPDDSTKELKAASFSTSGRRRFLKVENICNVRDLGGIPTADGRRIRYGLLFRGGEMNGGRRDFDDNVCRINSYGIAAMKRAGIAADLDMRTADEADNMAQSPLGSSVSYIRFEDANAYYYDKFWTTDTYIKAMQWTIDELRAGHPVFFHCIYGADRTGTLGFLMEALLGVNESNIATDYELTSFSYGLNSPPRRRGPKNELSVYKYKEMLQGVKTSSKFTGSSLQERVRNFFTGGYPGSGGKSAVITATDLDWFTDFVLESAERK